MGRGVRRVLVIATHNLGKLEEFADLLMGYPFELVGAGALGLAVPEETEADFAGNAALKARAAARASGQVALADDSGLCIDALGGAPGVHSADWAETPAGRDFGVAIGRVEAGLRESGAARPWGAEFRCALALAWPDGRCVTAEGSVRGEIVLPGRGTEGHGYDPIFRAEGEAKGFGEIDRWVKNRQSHRARALAALEPVLREVSRETSAGDA
ncbi:MAG: non-canonical purine NTP pyrophosphatase [Alphaproteobacteria bacterium]|nr:non-canonical purine NTP pyrophosphatase [Alphaproteobacteria bacterium]